MGVIVNFVEEVRLRIEKAKSDSVLSYRDIFVGTYDQSRKDIDFPVVMLKLTGASSEAVCAPWGMTDNLTLQIQYVANKKSDNNNITYKTSDTSGSLYDLENLLDYLEKKRSDGSIDMTFAGTVYDETSYTYDINYDYDDLIVITITLSTKCAKFQRGAR